MATVANAAASGSLVGGLASMVSTVFMGSGALAMAWLEGAASVITGQAQTGDFDSDPLSTWQLLSDSRQGKDGSDGGKDANDDDNDDAARSLKTSADEATLLKAGSNRRRVCIITGAITATVYCIITGSLPKVLGRNTETRLLTLFSLSCVDIFKLELVPAIFVLEGIMGATERLPFLDAMLKFASGPGLFTAGILTAAAGILKQKRGNGTIGNTVAPPCYTGVYARVRHPIYAGLLGMALGLSCWMESDTRLYLSFLLWYLLHQKADLDEKRLLGTKHQDAYALYKTKVRTKFIPLLWPKSISIWSPFWFEFGSMHR